MNDTFHVFSQLTHYREKAEVASSDLAAEKIKTSTLKNEVQVKILNKFHK